MLFPDLDEFQVRIQSYDNGLQNTVLAELPVRFHLCLGISISENSRMIFLYLKTNSMGYLPVQYKTFLSVIFITILKI